MDNNSVGARDELADIEFDLRHPFFTERHEFGLQSA
jgi:hypothetical protein